MKKILINTLLTTAMLAALLPTAFADITGEVYTTDIGAVIDGNPIKSYNISDSTYVKAEDLRGYGFDVVWDAEALTLSITPNDSMPRTVLAENEINIKKADIPVHQKLYDVYSTDIKTYLNGVEINACNIDGETLVKFADLSAVGYVNYNDADRLASLDVIKYRLNKEYDNAENKEEITIADGVTYIGQQKDGKPNGVGRMYDKSQKYGFPGTINDITTTAFYTDGAIDGMYTTEGTYQYTIGSDLGTYQKTEFGNTKINYEVLTNNYHVYNDGLYYEISTVKGMPQYYENGILLRGGWDNSYLYCVSSENLPNVSEYMVYMNGDVGLVPDNLPKFSKFSDEEYFDTKAVSEEGKLYTLPYSEDYKAAVYAKEQKNAKHYIENGTLYEDFDDGNGIRVIDTDVKMFDGESYMIYLKNDGSVWTYRANHEYGEWMDGMDYSKPVKRAEDASYVSCGDLTCMYVKNDGSLWGFGLSENGELKYKEEIVYSDDRVIDYNEVYGREHIKLGDGFVSCKTGTVCLALDKNNALWAWGDNVDSRIDKNMEAVITEPLKLADDVKDYVYSGAIYIIKNDGTLWYKGNPYYNRQRYIDETIDEFTQCTAVYKQKYNHAE